MSGQKLPPLQQTLTQMSRHAKKRRYTDAALSLLAQNTHRHELCTSRVVSIVHTQSIAPFGGFAAEDNDVIDRL